MDPSKKLIALVAAFVFILFLAALCRITCLLATRKTLDLASTEMKSYMCGFILAACCMLGIAVLAGDVPTRGGHFNIKSDPTLFLLAVVKVVVLFALCIYGLVKSLRRDRKSVV